MGIITSILVLSLLIFFHELGHFLAAKYFGVRVEVFSIGFGTKIFSKKIGDTEYIIASIPLGGYVKMKGQDDRNPLSNVDGEGSYSSKKSYQRLIILAAGAGANFLLAFFLYIAIALMGHQSLAPVVGEIKEGYPAHKAGILPKDKIISIDDKPIREWMDISRAIEGVNSHEPITVVILREGREIYLKMNTTIGDSTNLFKEEIKKRMIGISPSGDLVTL